MSLNPRCAVCDGESELVGGKMIYPHRQDLWSKKFWLCLWCTKSYCGCHGKTSNSLGRPADAPLRKMRSMVHRVLDPLWKDGTMGRNEVYARLSRSMGLAREETHVGMFDQDQCKEALVCLEDMSVFAESMRDHADLINDDEDWTI